MSGVEWFGEETSAGCAERSFLLRRRSGTVPGVLCTGCLQPLTTADVIPQ
jgi:hypothetical protein